MWGFGPAWTDICLWDGSLKVFCGSVLHPCHGFVASAIPRAASEQGNVWFGIFFFWLRPFQCLFFNLKYILGSARKANQLFFL